MTGPEDYHSIHLDSEGKTMKPSITVENRARNLPNKRVQTCPYTNRNQVSQSRIEPGTFPINVYRLVLILTETKYHSRESSQEPSQ
jgi:hypothetical protein